jgi:hypothetical protein
MMTEITVAFESRKLTPAEQAFPAHVLELLVVVHAFWVLRHYLPKRGAPCPPSIQSDFLHGSLDGHVDSF